MDRNYFLSYSQIVFLLLLSTIGKLNARVISSTGGESELLHYTDIKDTDQYPYVSDTFLQKSVVCGTNHHTENGDPQYNLFKYSLQNNFPIVNDWDFFLLTMTHIKSVFVWNKWRAISSDDYTEVLDIVKKVNRFYISSVKLIDGFKFIIKIPDKLNIIS